MKSRITFHLLAAHELNEAAQYYEKESPGLGNAFITEIERCIERIVERPESAPKVLGTVRRRLLRNFPYGVLYSIKTDGIRILGIMNLRRRPTYWVGRR